MAYLCMSRLVSFLLLLLLLGFAARDFAVCGGSV